MGSMAFSLHMGIVLGSLIPVLFLESGKGSKFVHLMGALEGRHGDGSLIFLQISLQANRTDKTSIRQQSNFSLSRESNLPSSQNQTSSVVIFSLCVGRPKARLAAWRKPHPSFAPKMQRNVSWTLTMSSQ